MERTRSMHSWVARPAVARPCAGGLTLIGTPDAPPAATGIDARSFAVQTLFPARLLEESSP